MRSLFTLPLLAVSLSLSVPVAAQDRAPESEIVEKLNDPAFQDGLASMMAGFMTAMMDLPVGQFAAVMEQAVPDDLKKGDRLSRVDPDATLGDLARKDDPDFDRNIEGKMRKGTAMMGIMASEFGAMLPQLREMGEKMKRRMGELE